MLGEVICFLFHPPSKCPAPTPAPIPQGEMLSSLSKPRAPWQIPRAPSCFSLSPGYLQAALLMCTAFPSLRCICSSARGHWVGKAKANRGPEGKLGGEKGRQQPPPSQRCRGGLRTPGQGEGYWHALCFFSPYIRKKGKGHHICVPKSLRGSAYLPANKKNSPKTWRGYLGSGSKNFNHHWICRVGFCLWPAHWTALPSPLGAAWGVRAWHLVPAPGSVPLTA